MSPVPLAAMVVTVVPQALLVARPVSALSWVKQAWVALAVTVVTALTLRAAWRVAMVVLVAPVVPAATLKPSWPHPLP